MSVPAWEEWPLEGSGGEAAGAALVPRVRRGDLDALELFALTVAG